MTADEVLERVRDVAAIARDDEVAHSKEDDLWLAVLRHIAAGGCSGDCAQALAEAAVKTREIDFHRWCA